MPSSCSLAFLQALKTNQWWMLTRDPVWAFATQNAVCDSAVLESDLVVVSGAAPENYWVRTCMFFFKTKGISMHMKLKNLRRIRSPRKENANISRLPT